VLASTAAPPSETRGAFFWVHAPAAGANDDAAQTLQDVNVFPRASEDVVADLRSARAAVDAAGFSTAFVGVWLNAAEAAYELADAATAATAATAA
jgi:hypothetical protein